MTIAAIPRIIAIAKAEYTMSLVVMSLCVAAGPVAPGAPVAPAGPLAPAGPVGPVAPVGPPTKALINRHERPPRLLLLIPSR
jgi:hypothetical protein